MHTSANWLSIDNVRSGRQIKNLFNMSLSKDNLFRCVLIKSNIYFLNFNVSFFAIYINTWFLFCNLFHFEFIVSCQLFPVWSFSISKKEIQNKTKSVYMCKMKAQGFFCAAFYILNNVWIEFGIGFSRE